MTIAVALLVSSILLVWVVPQFEEVFKGFGADLPAFTQMIVAASRFMVSYWWLILMITAGAIFAFIFFKKRSLAFQHFLDRLILKVPIIGEIMRNASIARFARTLGVTFKAGVPLVEALDTISGATGNTVYEKAVLRMRDDVAVGYPVNVSMKQTNLFPHMVIPVSYTHLDVYKRQLQHHQLGDPGHRPAPGPALVQQMQETTGSARPCIVSRGLQPAGNRCRLHPVRCRWLRRMHRGLQGPYRHLPGLSLIHI